MQGLHEDISHNTREEFTRNLLSEQQVNSPRLLHTEVKMLGGQVIDLLVLIRHLRDKLRNVKLYH